MSQQIYNFIKFLEKKEGRTPPAVAVVKYGTDEQKNDEGIQLAAVEEEWDNIAFIKNPTEPVQLAAVKQNGLAIEYIYRINQIRPSENVQIAAVEQDCEAIKYIINPSEPVQMAAVEYAVNKVNDILKNDSHIFLDKLVTVLSKLYWAFVIIRTPKPEVSKKLYNFIMSIKNITQNSDMESLKKFEKYYKNNI